MFSRIWRPQINKVTNFRFNKLRLCSNRLNRENYFVDNNAISSISSFNSSVRLLSSTSNFKRSTNGSSNESNANKSFFLNYQKTLKFFAKSSVLAIIIYQINHQIDLKAKESKPEQVLNQDELAKQYGRFNKKFKTIKIDELNKHNCKENRIWIAFREGVYDVTDFVSQHPGGDIIMMAAGNRVDSFWNVYANHKTKKTLDLLETYRVANIELEEEESILNEKVNNDPFLNDPIRNSMLKVHTEKPFNAETPSLLIGKDFLTPNEVFFVRNHLPVPEIDEQDYRLEINGLGLDKTYEFTLNDLKKFTQHEVICSIQCAGNRRDELSEFGEIKGLPWNKGAISNAKWTGVYLVDLLKAIKCDVNNKEIKHVICEGYDFDPTSTPYSASVQSEYALDPNNKVLIALKMNDEDIPRDHGYPVRFIAPGIAGARNVKWLGKITLSNEEADSHWQRSDYKSFTPDVKMSNVDFKKGYSIQQLPVQSAICEPNNLSKISIKQIKNNAGKIKLIGYAWSGGGRKIIRVDVSKVEQNKDYVWKCAKLFGEEQFNKKIELDNRLRNRLITFAEHKEQCNQLPTDEMNQDTFKSYAWVIWSAEIEIDEKELKKGNKLVFTCKATDSSYNTQPENAKALYNFRGVLNNAWHKIEIEIE